MGAWLKGRFKKQNVKEWNARRMKRGKKSDHPSRMNEINKKGDTYKIYQVLTDRDISRTNNVSL